MEVDCRASSHQDPVAAEVLFEEEPPPLCGVCWGALVAHGMRVAGKGEGRSDGEEVGFVGPSVAAEHLAAGGVGYSSCL